MDAGVWVHFAAIIFTLDVFLFFPWLALYVDRKLMGDDRRWRFSLGAMMLFVTVAALNLGALAGLAIRP